MSPLSARPLTPPPSPVAWVTGTAVPFDVEKVRAEFPILGTTAHGKPLVYVDNAATSQKPRAVIEATGRYYAEQNANIHRGVYQLSEQATAAYESVRARAAAWIGAPDPREVIFVRGTTEGINLVASSWGRKHLGAGDEVVITAMEHHSNIVPWQLICDERGATLRVIPMNRQGELLMDEAAKLIGPRTKMVAVAHVSNSLGTINPVKDLVALAHAHGALVLVDGAQAAPHMPVNVADLGCDFYTISAHKTFGPTGTGLLWGRAALLEAMPPYQGGGDMIRSVTFEKTTFAPIPAKFEAGTPNIGGVIGFGAAIDWMRALPWDQVQAHEAGLLRYAVEQLCDVPGLTLVGTAAHKASVVSFVLDGVHPHDVGTIVDQEGVAVRTGHHCTQPVMDFLGVPATTRASFALYNTRADVDALAAAVRKVRKLFD
jgi:cysteine desulfurase/selenocysteine lyase